MKNPLQDIKLDRETTFMLAVIGVLQFIYSVPHSIGFRKLLLLIAFAMTVRYAWRALTDSPNVLRPLLGLYGGMQLWMLAISVWVADNTRDSLIEWKGQWLPPFLSFVAGIGLAQALTQKRPEQALTLVLSTLLIPVTLYLCINDIEALLAWMRLGTFEPLVMGGSVGIAEHHGVSGYLVALLLPVAVIDLLCRSLGRSGLLPVRTDLVWALLALLVGTLLLTANRSGLVAALVTLFLSGFAAYREILKAVPLRKILSAGLLVCGSGIVIGAISYKTDPRWQTFLETIPIAWDIDRDQRWLNVSEDNLPLTSAGERVDTSEYSRIAWLHEGLRMLATHPWGREMSRAAFHKLELEQHGQASMSHSHNSWVDLGLQVGIPGMLMWAGVLWLIGHTGWQAWRREEDALGLALMVLVAMYALRGLIDSIFRDHELDQFMLVAGMLYWTVVLRRKPQAIRTAP